ncbi:MAG: hypothetical protein N3G22_01420 [Candidatus Micrarchaeota archaeon]|nr:hypothetical protein [Candidatus Micrarchaeota archaeon]
MGLKKGQYFSFDAIVAAVIGIIALSTLIAYWSGAQSAVDSRALPLHSEAARMSAALLSPGEPANWTNFLPPSGGIGGNIRQVGIASQSGVLNRTKVNALIDRIGVIGGPSSPKYPAYLELGRILHTPSNYYILLEASDSIYSNICSTSSVCLIGWPPPANATEVAIFHRGAVSEEGIPVRVRVFLWR